MHLVNNFDDLVVYLGENELYAEICEYLSLAVNNNSPGTVYVHNWTQGTYLSSPLNSGDPGTCDILSGSRTELLNGPGGSGSAVISTPPTPIALAGQGRHIDVP